MSHLIKEVGVLSCAKIGGMVYGLMGLIGGLLFSMIAILGVGLGAAENELGDMFGVFMGVGAIIFLPVLYGIIGFVGGAITALFYNLIAGFFGGLEITLEAKPAPMRHQYPSSPSVSA
ncbi:MAG: hypothetical protein ACE5GA_07180 [Candidatus Zixiibacteriota bacterium]